MQNCQQVTTNFQQVTPLCDTVLSYVDCHILPYPCHFEESKFHKLFETSKVYVGMSNDILKYFGASLASKHVLFICLLFMTVLTQGNIVLLSYARLCTLHI